MRPRDPRPLLLAALLAPTSACSLDPHASLLHVSAPLRQHIGRHDPLRLRLEPVLGGERAEVRFTGRCRRGGEPPRSVRWRRVLRLPAETEVAVTLSKADIERFGAGAGCRGRLELRVLPEEASAPTLRGIVERLELDVGESPPNLRAQAAAWLARIPLRLDPAPEATRRPIATLLLRPEGLSEPLGALWYAEGLPADEPEDLLPPPGRTKTHLSVRSLDGSPVLRPLWIGPDGLLPATRRRSVPPPGWLLWLPMLALGFVSGRAVRPLPGTCSTPCPALHEVLVLTLGATLLAAWWPLASPHVLSPLLGLGLLATLWDAMGARRGRARRMARGALVVLFAVLLTLGAASRLGLPDEVAAPRAAWILVAMALAALAASIVPPDAPGVAATVGRGSLLLASAALAWAQAPDAPFVARLALGGLWATWSVVALATPATGRWTGWATALAATALLEWHLLPDEATGPLLVSLSTLLASRTPRTVVPPPHAVLEWTAA